MAQRRRRYQRRYQRRRRAAAKLRHVQVELSRGEARWFDRMRSGASVAVREFARRALLVGAAFVYNAGNQRGGKRRAKPPPKHRRPGPPGKRRCQQGRP